MDTRSELLSAHARSARFPVLALAVAMAGCSTQIRADRSDARIYRDGEYLGTGTATTSSTGLPGTVVFTVEADGHRRETNVSREFRFSTFFVGLFTYATGWLWCWQLPAEVNLLAPERSAVSLWQLTGHATPWRRATVAAVPSSAPAPVPSPAPAPESAPESAAVPASAPAPESAAVPASAPAPESAAVPSSAPAPESAAVPSSVPPAPGSTPWRSSP